MNLVRDKKGFIFLLDAMFFLMVFGFTFLSFTYMRSFPNQPLVLPHEQRIACGTLRTLEASGHLATLTVLLEENTTKAATFFQDEIAPFMDSSTSGSFCYALEITSFTSSPANGFVMSAHATYRKQGCSKRSDVVCPVNLFRHPNLFVKAIVAVGESSGV